MELNMEFDKKMLEKTAVETANRVLDKFEYNGKTIREWADLIANPKTNADRIRAMTDKELDKFLGEVQWDVANYCGGVTQKQKYPVPEQSGAWLDWLKQEVECGDSEL